MSATDAMGNAAPDGPPLQIVECSRVEWWAFINPHTWDDGGAPWVTIIALFPRPEVDGLKPGPVHFMCEGQSLALATVVFVEPARSAENESSETRVLVDTATYRRTPPDHRGFCIHRLGQTDYTGLWEQAFADEWTKENREEGWTAEGVGFLQLMVNQGHRHRASPGDRFLTTRERRLCASVIQWLGTNCGRSFIDQVFLRVGAKRPDFAITKPPVSCSPAIHPNAPPAKSPSSPALP